MTRIISKGAIFLEILRSSDGKEDKIDYFFWGVKKENVLHISFI